MDEPVTLSANDENDKSRADEQVPVPSIWSQPVHQLVIKFVRTTARPLSSTNALKNFLSLTGGSVLYCLSALSIIYGIVQIIGPPLAKSNVFSETLPSVLALNAYELALLGVLVLIVMWKNVTDDAISLVVLIALFLIATGMTLSTVVTSGPQACLYIGLACTILGIGKLYVMRRCILFRF